MTFTYQPAAKPMQPSGKCQRGCHSLRDTMFYLTPGLIDSGCYNPRNVAGTGTVSLHAEGRAIDVRPDNFQYKPGPWLDEGAAAALWDWCRSLAIHHAKIGVQRIIWAGWMWTVGGVWRKLSVSANQHYDHAHIELNWWAAKTLIPETIIQAIFPGDNDMTPEQALQLNELHFALVGARKYAGDKSAHDLATVVLETHMTVGLLSSNLRAAITEVLDQQAAGEVSITDEVVDEIAEAIVDNYTARLVAASKGE